MKLLFLILLSMAPMAMGQSHHHLGWKSGPPSKLRQFVHHPAYATTVITPSSDLRGKDMPDIFDQSQIGSCTANAGDGAFEFMWHKQTGSFPNLSRLGLYTDSLKHDGNWPNDAGSFTGTVVWVLTNQGIGTEKCYPYNTSQFGTEPPACYAQQRPSYKLVKGYDVDNGDGKSIRVALSAGFPVIFGGYVYQAIENLTASNDILPMPQPGEQPIGGHEMVIVGHDDATQLYTLRNSWGTSYGKAGYIRAPYAYIHNTSICQDFAVLEVTNGSSVPTPIPPPTPGHHWWPWQWFSTHR